MIKISLVHSVAFVWIGKFVAPSENWRHIARKLYEYELMMVHYILLMKIKNMKFMKESMC